MKPITSLLFILFSATVSAQTFVEVFPTPPFEGLKHSSVAFSDVDGDGDQDVLTTGITQSFTLIAELYTNEGLGNYTQTEHPPFQPVWDGSIAFADIDGDGDEDVLITGHDGFFDISSILYTNDGLGNFTEAQGTPFDGVRSSSVAFSDIDGDGDQDLLITGENHSFDPIAKLYTNDGSGNFTEVQGTPFEGVKNSSIAFSDIDGDGDEDVLITGEESEFNFISSLYTNDGSGSFTLVAGTPFEGVSIGSVAFSDLDGDDDKDLLILGQNVLANPSAKLFRNDGSGNFTEVQGTSFEGGGYSKIELADVDQDGDQDVLIALIKSFSDPMIKLYANDGSGIFTEVIGTSFPGIRNGSTPFLDIDNDGDQDLLIIGEDSSFTNIAKLYTNDGSGNFAEVFGAPFEGIWKGSFAFADIDGDTDQDVLITGRTNALESFAKLYTNDGVGNFIEVENQPIEGVWTSSIAFADVNGDDNLDLLIAGEVLPFDYQTILYLNDGMGNYSKVQGTPFDGVFGGSVAFSDIDGDDDQDVLITGSVDASNSNGIAKLYTNDGSGNFSLVQGTPFIGVVASSVAFADVDGDQDDDVLIAGKGTPGSNLYKNDGSGNFSLVQGTSFAQAWEGAVAFSDIDGDGDQDLLSTGRGFSELYLNDGSGNFSQVQGTPFEGIKKSSIAFADVDGDEDQDVLISGETTSSSFISKLFTNNGSGNFTEAQNLPFEAVEYGSVAFSDIDGDADMDVLIAGNNGSSYITKLYLNNDFVSAQDFFVEGQPGFVLFPNPTESYTINLRYISDDIGSVEITVFDLRGRQLFRQQEGISVGEQIFSFDLSVLSKGTYFFQLTTQEQRLIKKFILR
ncbi:MAG: T9SS type A sorting domain-containing protein [Bacteroidota bacterium]